MSGRDFRSAQPQMNKASPPNRKGSLTAVYRVDGEIRSGSMPTDFKRFTER